MLQLVRFRVYPVCINLAGRIFSLRNIADVRKEFVWSFRIMTAGESRYVRQQTVPRRMNFPTFNRRIEINWFWEDREWAWKYTRFIATIDARYKLLLDNYTNQLMSNFKYTGLSLLFELFKSALLQ